MMDISLCIQIRNLTTLKLRHILRLSKKEFRTFSLLLLFMLSLSCKNSDNSITKNDFSLLKLYKITFFEHYEYDGSFAISSEFIIVNESDMVQPPKIRTKLQTIIKNKTSVLSLRWQG